MNIQQIRDELHFIEEHRVIRDLTIISVGHRFFQQLVQTQKDELSIGISTEIRNMPLYPIFICLQLIKANLEEKFEKIIDEWIYLVNCFPDSH